MKKEINLLILSYTERLNNLKENRAIECDKLSDAENHDLDNQIRLTAEFIRNLKALEKINNLL